MGERINLERARKALMGKLSPREFQTFVGILDGKSVAQISEEVHGQCTAGSFSVYASQIFRKLNTKGRANLVYWAKDRDLFEEGAPNDLMELSPVPPALISGKPRTSAVGGGAVVEGASRANLAAVIPDPVPATSEEIDKALDKAMQLTRAERERQEQKKPPPAAVARPDQYLTPQEIHGKSVSMIVRQIGEHQQKITATRTKALTFEVLNLGDSDLCWIVEREHGRIVVLHNASAISEIHFAQEESSGR